MERTKLFYDFHVPSGPMGTRTPDLRIANAMLYQLSYRPGCARGRNRTPNNAFHSRDLRSRLMVARVRGRPSTIYYVGVGGIEPSTSSL